MDNANQNELNLKLSQAKQAEQKGEYFSASFFYKDVLKNARNVGDSEKIKLYKAKLLEMNQKLQGDFKPIQIEQQIPTAEIDNFIEKLLSYEIEQILYVIGMHPNFCPNSNDIKITTSKTMPISYQFARMSTISDTGHSVSGGDEPNHHWFCQLYQFNQDIIINTLLAKVFYKLQENGRLTKENLSNHLTSVQIASENELKVLEVALERYFAKDYVSALHILIPQFEVFFLSASEKAGIDVISLNQTKEISTQPKTLGLEQLNKLEFQNFWGKDLCEQIKFILYESLGYKLRHRVAHGEIIFEECSFTSTTLLIYLFLTICSRRIKQLVEAEAKRD